MGPAHVFAVVNSRLAALDRDGTVQANESFVDFFPALEAPERAFEIGGSDPQAVYDAHHDRFVVAVAEVRGHQTETPADDRARVHFALSEPGNPKAPGVARRWTWRRRRSPAGFRGPQSARFAAICARLRW